MIIATMWIIAVVYRMIFPQTVNSIGDLVAVMENNTGLSCITASSTDVSGAHYATCFTRMGKHVRLSYVPSEGSAASTQEMLMAAGWYFHVSGNIIVSAKSLSEVDHLRRGLP